MRMSIHFAGLVLSLRMRGTDSSSNFMHKLPDDTERVSGQ
jgi:hypothetical protein